MHPKSFIQINFIEIVYTQSIQFHIFCHPYSILCYFTSTARASIFMCYTLVTPYHISVSACILLYIVLYFFSRDTGDYKNDYNNTQQQQNKPQGIDNSYQQQPDLIAVVKYQQSNSISNQQQLYQEYQKSDYSRYITSDFRPQPPPHRSVQPPPEPQRNVQIPPEPQPNVQLPPEPQRNVQIPPEPQRNIQPPPELQRSVESHSSKNGGTESEQKTWGLSFANIQQQQQHNQEIVNSMQSQERQITTFNNSSMQQQEQRNVSNTIQEQRQQQQVQRNVTNTIQEQRKQYFNMKTGENGFSTIQQQQEQWSQNKSSDGQQCRPPPVQLADIGGGGMVESSGKLAEKKHEQNSSWQTKQNGLSNSQQLKQRYSSSSADSNKQEPGKSIVMSWTESLYLRTGS